MTPLSATSRPGLYFDPAKMHVLDHKGKYLKVRGPLNIARPVQGWPVIVQAGASDDGRQLAAETAEVVFTGGGSLADGQKLYADIKGRMDKLGRDRDHLKILPGAFVVVGDSVEEAKEKRALLDSRVHYDSAIASLSVILGTDASGFDPDGQLPDIPETNASKSGRQRAGRCRRPRQAHRAPTRPAASAAMAACRSSARPQGSPTRWRSG